MCQHDAFHLVKQGDVQREAKTISQVDLVCQSVAELTGCGGRVGQESLGGAVHKRHRQHDGLLRFSGLRGKNDQNQAQILKYKLYLVVKLLRTCRYTRKKHV